jgi:hypothetical protein
MGVPAIKDDIVAKVVKLTVAGEELRRRAQAGGKSRHRPGRWHIKDRERRSQGAYKIVFSLLRKEDIVVVFFPG